MAGGRSERREAAARDLRDQIKAAGQHAEAQVIDEVLRTLAATRATLKTIHRDNMHLRRQLGLPSFLHQQTQQR